jgi:hypothetical protein
MLSRTRALVLLLLAAGAAACAASADAAFGTNGESPSGKDDGGSPMGSSGASSSSGGSTPDVDGVIAVHASRNLPAFRLCFSNRPGINPLPDSKLMPQSNVVGVEVGSAVHIGELRLHVQDFPDGGSPKDGGGATDAASADSGPAPTADAGPGTKAYVFREDVLRFRSQVCGDLLKDPSLKAGTDYWPVDFPSNTTVFSNQGVYLIAVEGCVANAGDPQLSADTCGQPFTAGQSNLRINVQSLSAPKNPGGAFFAQVLVLSDPVRAAIRKKQTANVYFGQLDGKLDRFDQNNALLENGPPQPRDVPQQFAFPGDQLDSYQKYGIRAEIAQGKVDQTLARTQELTQPALLPTEFYRLPSNFVVLLLGDPAIAQTEVGRSLHFLAIPVRDPDQLGDGGADGASSAGDR